MVTATQFLRQNTHAGHVALERTPLACDLMGAELSLHRYVAVLAAWAAAWTALENSIWSSPAVQQVADLLPHRVLHLAHNDLQYWREQGYSVPDKTRHIDQVSHHWSALQPMHASDLLGVCYVARGASLGSKVIAARLRKTLNLNDDRGISFFGPSAPTDAPVMTWPQWSARLDARLDSPESLALAVVWANATFAALHRSFVDADQTQPVNS